jgi:hypothetical protein
MVLVMHNPFDNRILQDQFLMKFIYKRLIDIYKRIYKNNSQFIQE